MRWLMKKGMYAETGRNDGRLVSIRRNRASATISVLAMTLLLFPIFSTADDFHACHLSFAALASPAPSRAQTSAATQMAKSSDDDFCFACVWSSFESAAPAPPISITPTQDASVTFVPVISCHPVSSDISSIFDRAPPIA
jgi:hypothetical protein